MESFKKEAKDLEHKEIFVLFSYIIPSKWKIYIYICTQPKKRNIKIKIM